MEKHACPRKPTKSHRCSVLIMVDPSSLIARCVAEPRPQRLALISAGAGIGIVPNAELLGAAASAVGRCQRFTLPETSGRPQGVLGKGSASVRVKPTHDARWRRSRS